jgi:protocatechuate 3,4-dioxygenase beta subunit
MNPNPALLDDDDKPVGRVLSRREVLELIGLGSVAVVAAACAPGATASPGGTSASASASSPAAASAPATAAASASGGAVVPSCVVRPELTEGPYFVDEKLERSDIRIEPSDGSTVAGTQLDLAFLVSRVADGTCEALEGALVDVWHCDAAGVYSDVSDPGFDTSGKKFLRGYQVTDATGRAAFTTIYPGWYQGRTVHIHFKIRTDATADQGLEFTSQLFFDDALTDQVFAAEPYAAKGERTLRNDGDGIFNQSGDQLTLAAAPSGAGYAATFEVGVQT